MKYKYVNTTPHTVKVVNLAENVVQEYESEDPKRPSRLEEGIQNVDDDHVREIVIEKVTDLPEPQDGVRYIVSKYTALYLKDTRDDLVFPDALIRGGGGDVIGCRWLARFE